MAQAFKRGDRVEWNFRGRKVIGRVRRRLTARTEVGGQVVARLEGRPPLSRAEREERQGDRPPGRRAHTGELVANQRWNSGADRGWWRRGFLTVSHQTPTAIAISTTNPPRLQMLSLVE